MKNTITVRKNAFFTIYKDALKASKRLAINNPRKSERLRKTAHRALAKAVRS